MTQFDHDGSSESEEVILMVETHLAQDKTNDWYLDTRCINLMTGNKNGLIKLNDSLRRSI